MLVRAVAGIDHARPDRLGKELRRAGRAVPQDDDIGVIRFENLGGVFERFAFRQAGSRRRDIDDVRAQANGGELEGSAGARARFDEEIDQRLAAQRRDFLYFARSDLFEGVSRLEDEGDLLRGKLAQAQQIFARPALRFVYSWGFRSQTPSGSSSTFSRRTRTRSARAVGRFFPT